MSFRMAALLAHSEQVPSSAREALRAADAQPSLGRLDLLASAARILHDETGVDCADARELVDLVAEGDCA